MAEAPLKRQREEVHGGEDYVEDTKRHKSYGQILYPLLETEEEVPIQDLSFLMSTLEHELSCDDSIIDPLVFFTSSDHTTIDPENPSMASSKFTISDCSSSSTDHTNNSLKEEDEEEEDVEEVDDKERVMRHLLEASDHELGIPQAEIRYINGEEDDEINGGDGFFSLCHGLWEFEDEAANYYTYLQSELFM